MSHSTVDSSQILPPTAENLRRAAAWLRAGGLCAMPTETVYGLAAHALDEAAVASIFVAKARPKGHPLIVHVASWEQARQLCRAVPPEAEALARAFWPGPLTLILPRAAHIPDVVTGGRDTVAVRVPAHPVALALLTEVGAPLAAPSANRHEHVSPTRAEHVVRSLGAAAPLVLDGGPTQAGIESTIVDLSVTPPRVLRPGPVSPSALRALLPTLQVEALRIEHDAVHSAPGLSRRHYAPALPVQLVDRAALMARAAEPGVLWLALGDGALPGRGLLLPASPEGYAAGLFAALHRLESAAGTQILIERPPDDESWLAVHDRLRRAAAT